MENWEQHPKKELFPQTQLACITCASSLNKYLTRKEIGMNSKMKPAPKPASKPAPKPKYDKDDRK